MIIILFEERKCLKWHLTLIMDIHQINMEKYHIIQNMCGNLLKNIQNGTYLVTMPGHITVIKNGTLYDTFDCRNRRMWNAWKTN